MSDYQRSRALRNRPPARRSTTLLLAGLGVAASWLYVRARTRQVEREHPPEGKFVTVDGVRLHYLERGEGPALVLLHGIGVHSKDFELSGLLDAAARHYRVIAFDRPGYGYSDRPRTTVWTPDKQARLLHRALKALNVDSAIVLGHSWGTLPALAMGLQAPEVVRGLVLLGGYYYPSLRAEVPFTGAPALPLVGDLLSHTVSPVFSRMLWRPLTRRTFAPMPVSGRFKGLPVWMALRPKQLRATAADSAMLVPGAAMLARHYRELKVPVRILAGTGDRIIDFTHNSERLQGSVPDGQLELYPGVGHMLHYAHPEKVVAAVDAIAAQVGEPVPLRDARAEALARASESGV